MSALKEFSEEYFKMLDGYNAYEINVTQPSTVSRVLNNPVSSDFSVTNGRWLITHVYPSNRKAVEKIESMFPATIRTHVKMRNGEHLVMLWHIDTIKELSGN